MGYRIITFLNSMLQENINRSMTSSDYAQTKYTGLGTTNQRGHNYVPFLNKSMRFASKAGDSSAPPIGSYNLPSCFDRKKSPFEDRISHFILQSQTREQQMAIFKSSLTRFQRPNNHSPGPASYNLFAQNNAQPRKTLTRSNKENAADLTRTCPSIPHKGNKYGYAVINGEMKNIEKTEQQLEKERESRKNYVETLQGQNYIFRESTYKDYHDADQRRRLYVETSKYLGCKDESEGHSRSESNLMKKPKYDHLYNSKPAPISNQHKLIGPGQYDIPGNFSLAGRKEKFQFFGSTQVRFKDKSKSPEKSYTLLQRIKESHNVEGVVKEKKSPFKKKPANGVHSQQNLQLCSPGPGQYNPQVQYSKQSRRITFFPLEQRFKEHSPSDEEIQKEVLADFGRSRSKKSYNTNTLKKERFKPMHQDYQPVKSEQICGILSEANESVSKIGKPPKRALGKVLRLNSKRGTQGDQEINSWSREETRKKGAYIRELKDQLAFISYSPVPEEASKKPTRKIEKKQQ